MGSHSLVRLLILSTAFFRHSHSHIPQAAAQYASEEGLLFLETSAKDSTNVSELFSQIARKLPLEQAAAAQNRSSGRGGSSINPSGAQKKVNLQGGGNNGNQATGGCC